jgi:Fe-S oxidoreductase
VALFYTCNANYWDPEAAIAAAQVLAHNGVRVLVPPQQCCGMPFLDAGAADLALKKARANVQSLAEVVRQGCDVVAPGPSCSLTIRKEYPHLLSTEDARLVAEHTFDVSEYLWRLKEKGALRTNFPNTVGKVAYHAACHLRAQFAGLRGADLIALIPGAQVERIERCSHHDGTWAIKKESRQLSLEYGEKLFQAMKDAEAHLFVSDCPLAATQIEDGTGRRPLHPMQVLKAAYGI